MGTNGTRRRRWARLLAWGLGLSTAGGAWAAAQGPNLPPAQAALPPKSYMNKNVFYLPVTLDERTRSALQEIHLYGKDDPSQPWTLRERITPNQSCFSFKAPRDGEYWFTVVTVDKRGRMVPPDLGNEQPGVIVVLDSQAPQVDVSALPESPDGAMVKVDVRDLNIDASKTRFYYQTGDKMWRSLDPVSGRLDQFCIPRQAVLTGMIKLACTDFANNAVTREFNLGTLVPAGATVGGLNSAAGPNLAPLPNTESEPPLAAAPQKVEPHQPSPFPSEEKITAAVGSGHKGGPAVPPPQAIEIVNVSGSASGPTTTQRVVGPNPVQQTEARAPVLPPSVKHAATPLSPIPETAVQVQKVGRPPESPVLNKQIVSHTHLFLDYQIEQMGASGVGNVEIWLTRDKGQTWQKHGDDADRQSPVEVDLPGEGEYGISLVVTNGRGFGGAPPAAGDTPDWWIDVDMTRPVAELLGVRPGSPDEAGALHITWNARDKHLSPAPIELYCAAKKEGPWQPIAKGLRNEGHYRWAVPGDLGPHAFIRLVATDAAGNATTCETAQPVPLDDLSRPRGRVTGISTGAPRVSLVPQN